MINHSHISVIFFYRFIIDNIAIIRKASPASNSFPPVTNQTMTATIAAGARVQLS